MNSSSQYLGEEGTCWMIDRNGKFFTLDVFILFFKNHMTALHIQKTKYVLK